MTPEIIRRVVIDPNFWVNAVKTVGFPIVVAGAVLYIYDKDNRARQELFSKLVESQIKQSETNSAVMVRTQTSMENIEKISRKQTAEHSTLIEAQKMALLNHGKMLETQSVVQQNQGKIIEGITKDCDTTKELIAIQKKILDSLEMTRARPFTPPAPPPAKVNKST